MYTPVFTVLLKAGLETYTPSRSASTSSLPRTLSRRRKHSLPSSSHDRHPPSPQHLMTDALPQPPHASGSRPASYASNGSVEPDGLFDDLAFLEQATAAPKSKHKAGGGGGGGGNWFGRQKGKNAAQSRTAPSTPSRSKARRAAAAAPDSPESFEAVFNDLASIQSRQSEATTRPSTPRRKAMGMKFNIPSMGSLSRKAPRSLARSNTSSSNHSSSTITSFSTMTVSHQVMRAATPDSQRPSTVSSMYTAYTEYAPTDYSACLDDAKDDNVPPVPPVPALPPPTSSLPATPSHPEMLSAPPRKNSLGPGSSPILPDTAFDDLPPAPQLPPNAFAWGARREPGMSSSESSPARQANSNPGQSRSRYPTDAVFGSSNRRPSGTPPDSRRPSAAHSEGAEPVSRRQSTLIGTLNMPGARKLSHPLSAIDTHRGSVAMSVAESTSSPGFVAMVDYFPRPPSSALPGSRTAVSTPSSSARASPQLVESTPGSSPSSRRPSTRRVEPLAPPLEPSLPESPLLSMDDQLPTSPLFVINTKEASRHNSAGSSATDDIHTPATPSSPDFTRVPAVVLPIDDELERLLRSSPVLAKSQKHLAKPVEHARPESVMLPDQEFPGVLAVESPSEYTAEQVAHDYLSSRVRTTSQPDSRSRAKLALSKVSSSIALPPRPHRRSSAPHRCPTPTGHRSRPSCPDSPPPVPPQHSRNSSTPWMSLMGDRGVGF